MATINENIAKNITLLRKQNKWTQSELADKLNYSDKSISKWERGESIPDIEMLCKIAEIFNVNIEYLTEEHSEKEIKKSQNGGNIFVRNLLILIMMCVAVYLVSTIVFVYPFLFNKHTGKTIWVSYIFALPICALLCHFYARKMHIWLMRLITISVFVWSLITSLFCVAISQGYPNFWMLFLVGIPIQASICLYFFWRKTF